MDPVLILRGRMAGRSLRKLAKEIGISSAHLSDVMLGKKRPGPTILDFLEIEREITIIYRPKHKRG